MAQEIGWLFPDIYNESPPGRKGARGTAEGAGDHSYAPLALLHIEEFAFMVW